MPHLEIGEIVRIAGGADRQHPHLEECELCRELAALIAGMRSLEPAGPVPASRAARCIREPELIKLFGEQPAEAGPALSLVEHAAGCDRCGPRLKELAYIFNPDDDERVSEAVSGLRSSGEEWQRDLVARLANPARPQWAAWGWRQWGMVAASVLVVLAAAMGWNWLRGPSVETLLAQAYTERRPFDLRLPDRGYAPESQQMGPNSFLENRSLTKANADIVDLPEAAPRTMWLRGRAELIARDFDAAIASLENSGLPEPQTELDLGVAYALRGDTENRPEDWGRALDDISRYLETNPTSVEALYNKALLLERLQLIDDAIMAWDRYLEVDPEGEWAAEARRRRDALVQRKNARQMLRDRVTADASQLAALLDSGQPPDAEGFLSRTRFVEIRNQPQQVRNRLAELLVEQHRDGLLRDFFRDWTPAKEAAFRHFAEAVAATGQEDYRTAIREFRQAEAGFAAQRHSAGRDFAALQLSYALQRSVQPEECIQVAKRIVDPAAPGPVYAWMQAQARIQVASCLDIAGNPAAALTYLQQAQELAESHGYREAGMRASGIYSELLTTLGDRRAAWVQGVRDMAAYWKSAGNATGAYQILMNQFWAAQQAGWLRSATTLASAACRVIGDGNFPVVELSCRTELAGVAQKIGDERTTAAQLKRTAELADSLETRLTDPRSSAQQALIRYASALVDAGKLRDASVRLSRLEETLGSDAFETRLEYYSASGRLSLAEEHYAEAGHAIDQAKALVLERFTSLDRRSNPVETAEAAGLYRLAMESRLSRTAATGGTATGNGLRTEDLDEWEDFLARTRESAPARPVADLAGELKDETALILVRLRKGVAAWAVDDRGIFSQWIAVDSRGLDESIARLAQLCADPRSSRSEIEREGRRLYDWLIAPLAGRLEGRTLVTIEADGELASIPFAALVTKTGHYWGQDVAIERMESLAGYVRRRSQPQPGRHGQTMLVSNPAIRGSLARLYPPLRFAGEPVSETGGRTVIRLEGREATIGNIASRRGQADIFHFFGHATPTAEASALLLAASEGDADLVGADRVRNQNWSQTRLVILSACSTAQGLANRDSLVRAFLQAGATRVIASHWDVDASATAALFRRFYGQMERTGDTAQALHAAVRDTSLEEATAHPYYWAAFSLYGTR